MAAGCLTLTPTLTLTLGKRPRGKGRGGERAKLTGDRSDRSDERKEEGEPTPL